MKKSAQIRVRTEPEVKKQAETILEELGLTPSLAINMFYKQIVHLRALPFHVALPNATTRQAIRDAENKNELIHGDDLDDLIHRLEDEADDDA